MSREIHSFFEQLASLPEAMTARLKLLSPEWTAFQEQHHEWLAGGGSDVLYCLPEAAIDRLSQPHSGRRLLSPLADAGERALLALCRRYHAIGFLKGRPIQYAYLAQSPPRLFQDDLPGFDWSQPDWREYAQLEASQMATREAINLRLKGYVGWLLTSPEFLADISGLKKNWELLPEPGRPDLPLARPMSRPVMKGETPPEELDNNLAAFATKLEIFLNHWGLIELVTWDLPRPQGPLFPSLLPASAPAAPPGGLHIVLPLHYPLTHDDAVLHQILKLQRDLARDQGLDRSLAGLPHHRLYAQILEIVHWERVVTERYGLGKTPRGFVGHLVEALAEATGTQVETVEKWRKAAKACRAGRRSTVRPLKVGIA
jgi:hypothetical protein